MLFAGKKQRDPWPPSLVTSGDLLDRIATGLTPSPSSFQGPLRVSFPVAAGAPPHSQETQWPGWGSWLAVQGRTKGCDSTGLRRWSEPGSGQKGSRPTGRWRRRKVRGRVAGGRLSQRGARCCPASSDEGIKGLCQV